MVFVVHRSSSPSTFCSPPVHRLSTLARLPACLPGGLSVLWRMGLYRANVQTWIIPPPLSPAVPVVPPHPLSGATDPPPSTACGGHSPIFLFSYSFLSIPTSDGRSALQGGQTEKRPPTASKKATLAMSIFNEHFSLRRPAGPSVTEGGRPAKSHHNRVIPPSVRQSVRATLPSFLLNPSKSL